MDHATITGLAIGDALGAPFEFSSKEKIEKWDGEFCETLHPQKVLALGQWTDDTKMAICIAQAIVQDKKYVPETAAVNYVKWYNSGDLRGIGAQTAHALHNIIQGEHWTKAGTILRKGDVCGNGTVMRVAPIGLFYRRDFGKLYEYARKDAIITHNHTDAKDSSVALAHIIALIANGTRPQEAVRDAINTISEGNVKNALSIAEDMAFKSKRWTDAISLGVNGTAHQTLATAVFCALRYCDDGFKIPVVCAVKMGGDTDTRAAITGAIMGTYVGLDKVPEEYLDDLEHVEFLNAMDKVLSAGPDAL